jgi:hypothetical protein
MINDSSSLDCIFLFQSSGIKVPPRKRILINSPTKPQQDNKPSSDTSQPSSQSQSQSQSQPHSQSQSESQSQSQSDTSVKTPLKVLLFIHIFDILYIKVTIFLFENCRDLYDRVVPTQMLE